MRGKGTGNDENDEAHPTSFNIQALFIHYSHRSPPLPILKLSQFSTTNKKFIRNFGYGKFPMLLTNHKMLIPRGPTTTSCRIRQPAATVVLQKRSITMCAQSSATALPMAFSIGDGVSSSAVMNSFATSIAHLDVATVGFTKTLGILAVYSLFANLLYLARRASLRRMTIRELWKIRTTREEGVSRFLFAGMLVAWQVLVLIFPFVEPCLRFWRMGRHPLSPPQAAAYPRNTDRPGWTIFFLFLSQSAGWWLHLGTIGVPTFRRQSTGQATNSIRLAQVQVQCRTYWTRWFSSSTHCPKKLAAH